MLTTIVVAYSSVVAFPGYAHSRYLTVQYYTVLVLMLIAHIAQKKQISNVQDRKIVPEIKNLGDVCEIVRGQARFGYFLSIRNRASTTLQGHRHNDERLESQNRRRVE